MILINVLLLALVTLTATAAVIDFRTGHIPNGLVATGFVVGSLLHILAVCSAQPGAPASLAMLAARALADVALGVAVCGIGPFVLFQLDAMGGGDVKLLAAVGATAGPGLGIQIELLSLVLVALYALVRLAREGLLGRLVRNAATLVLNPFRSPSRREPLERSALTSLVFGPAIFLATLLVAFDARWLP